MNGLINAWKLTTARVELNNELDEKAKRLSIPSPPVSQLPITMMMMSKEDVSIGKNEQTQRAKKRKKMMEKMLTYTKAWKTLIKMKTKATIWQRSVQTPKSVGQGRQCGDVMEVQAAQFCTWHRHTRDYEDPFVPTEAALIEENVAIEDELS